MGEVYLGVALGQRARSIKIRLPGDRERIREYTTTSLLDFARRVIGGSSRPTP